MVVVTIGSSQQQVEGYGGGGDRGNAGGNGKFAFQKLWQPEFLAQQFLETEKELSKN